MNKLTIATLAILTIALSGCPTDWGKEAEKVNQSEDWKACHFMEDGKEKARLDGYPCRPAVCAADGKSYVPRGVCGQSGTVCEGAAAPVQCGPDEECTILEENPNGAQAVCAKNSR